MGGGIFSLKSKEHFLISKEALKKVPLFLTVSLIFGVVVGPSLAQEPLRPSTRAVRVKEEPILGGVLDEPSGCALRLLDHR